MESGSDITKEKIMTSDDTLSGDKNDDMCCCQVTSDVKHEHIKAPPPPVLCTPAGNELAIKI